MLVKLMVKGNFSIKGTSQIEKHLKRAATMNDVKNVVQLNTSEMQQKAQRKAPVDTGALKRYITLSVIDGGLTGRINALMNYSAYVEFGTRFQTAQPFIKPAYNEQKKQYERDLMRLVR